MDLIQGIINVFTFSNMFYCFAGCFLGTAVGVLPGLGPASTMAILLPITMYLDPTGSIIMLAGLYYGAQYGGSTTSILVNIPGEPSSVPTTFDGFPMTKQGRGGEALWIAAVGSFIASTAGCVALSIMGPGVAKYALAFGPPEYTGLLILSMTAIISLSGSSITRGLAVGIFGILLGSVGVDPMTGITRFTFGVQGLMRGFDIVSVAVGIFGVAEILISADAGIAKIYEGKIGNMMPRGKELKKGLWASVRGTILGFPLGLLPGITPGVVSFFAYDLEKKISKYPEKFGTGVIEGVAGPEAANNATAQAGFLPLMAFGIPTGGTMAILLAALMMYGLKPGPVLFLQNKDFVWTVIGSMYVGNVMLLLLNLPLVGLWARMATIPYKYMAPAVLAICLVASYTARNTLFDVWITLAFGVLGYAMRKNNWSVAPLVLGFILGPMLELSFRQSISMGGPTIFFTRYISAALLLAAVCVVVMSVRYLKRVPEKILEEDADS